MAQVKKYQTGTSNGGIQPTAAPTPSKLKFKINGQDYDLDEQAVQDMVTPAFEKMKAAGVVKEHNREDFTRTYQQYLAQAKSGTYDIKSSDGKYLSSDYSGSGDANLGLDANGKDAHKTALGNLVSPFSRDDHQRMAMLNTYLGDGIVAKHDADQAALKAKADGEAAKAKTAAEQARGDFVNKFATYQNPYSALYGKDGEGEAGQAWGSKQYWDLKKTKGNNPRVGLLNSGLSSLGKYVFDKQFDDADTQALFKKNTGYDVADLRRNFTSNGYGANGFGKQLDINGITKTLEDVDLHRAWQGVLTRPQQEAAAGAGTVGGTPAVKPGTPSGNEFVDDKGIVYADKNKKTLFTGARSGKLLVNGKIFSGVYNPDIEDNLNYEHSDRNQTLAGNYWNGVRVDPNTLNDNLRTSKDTSLLASVTAQREAQEKYRNGLFGGMTDLTKGDGYTDTNSTGLYAFEDLRGTPNEASHAQNLTDKFGDVYDKGENLYAFKSKGTDQFGNNGILRYRHISKTGTKFDGMLRKDKITGHFILDNMKGQSMDLGKYSEDNSRKITGNAFVRAPDNKPEAPKDDLDHSYYSAHKTGGVLKKAILKAQDGALFKGQKQQNTDFQSAQIRGQVLGNNDLSTADKVQLAGIAADLVGVGAGLAPGIGNAVAAGAGVTGTGLTYAANYMKHGFKWGDVGQAAMGLTMDAASILPGLGEASSIGKASIALKGMKNLGLIFAGVGAVKAGVSLSKLQNDEKMDVDDWQNIAQGLQGALGLKRATDKLVATKGTTEDFIKINGKNQPLPEGAATAIRNAVPSKKMQVATEQLAKAGFSSEGLDKATVEINQPGIKNWLADKVPLLKPKTDAVEVPVISSENGRALRDWSTANRWQKSAIKNVAAQNPSIAGAENFTIDGKPLTEPGGPKGLDWLQNAYKMKYTGNTSNQPTTPGAGLTTAVTANPRLALPPSSGQNVGGLGLPENGLRRNITEYSDGAVRSTVQTRAAQEAQDVADGATIADKRIAGKSAALSEPRAQPVSTYTNPSTNTHAENANYEISKAIGRKTSQLVGKNIVNNTELRKIVANPESRAPLTAFMNKQFPDGSQQAKVQAQLTKALATTKSRTGLKFKEGGLIPKAQMGYVFKSLDTLAPVAEDFNNKYAYKSYPMRVPGAQSPDTRAGLTIGDQGFLKINNTPAELSVGPPKTGALPQAQPVTNQTLITTPSPKPTQLQPVGANRGNSGWNIKLPNLNGIDTNTMSELGRALFSRQLNSQVDTKVERPMIQAPAEVTPSVQGNLYAKTSFDNQANNLIRQSNYNKTTDAAVNAATNLSANGQANQLRTQGNMANIEALGQSRQAALQATAQNNQVRANVANENTQTLARATQAERAANNEKFARMNQPLMDFWKDLDYKKSVEASQNKQYDTQIALQGKQNEFNTAVQPLLNRQNVVEQRMDFLTRKQSAGQLTQVDADELSNLTNEDNSLSNSQNTLTGRLTTLGLNTRKNVNYLTPKDYWTLPTKATGGKISEITKARTQAATQAAKNETQVSIETSKQNAKMIADTSDDETKKELSAMKDIQELIKLALS